MFLLSLSFVSLSRSSLLLFEAKSCSVVRKFSQQRMTTDNQGAEINTVLVFIQNPCKNFSIKTTNQSLMRSHCWFLKYFSSLFFSFYVVAFLLSFSGRDEKLLRQQTRKKETKGTWAFFSRRREEAGVGGTCFLSFVFVFLTWKEKSFFKKKQRNIFKLFCRK